MSPYKRHDCYQRKWTLDAGKFETIFNSLEMMCDGRDLVFRSQRAATVARICGRADNV